MAGGGWEPTDIANQALDAIGWPEKLGDINDGTDHANVLLRAYRECLKNLLRAAPWDFARKSAQLELLADASGNTANVGTVVPNPYFVYEYGYPVDCVKARFIPQNINNQASVIPPSNIQIGQQPQLDNSGVQPWVGGRILPSRFLIATDSNYPPPLNPIPYDTPGISPTGRTVVLSNVRNATLVYTAMMVYPSVWDTSFRSAFVAYLASEVALAIWAAKDAKFGIRMREAQLPLVKDKVIQARLNSANEGGPSTSDIRVDWMDTRYSAGPGMRSGWGLGGPGWGGDGPGMLWGGWDGLAVASGAVF